MRKIDREGVADRRQQLNSYYYDEIHLDCENDEMRSTGLLHYEHSKGAVFNVSETATK